MDNAIGPDLTPRGRAIRVFISSTFRDMQAERELLVKQVFPELRRLCSERFVTFTEVDLRWGITEEQADEGKVLPICLEEIRQSRPYFIGLLGERYGWIPDSVPQKVLEREPWLLDHVGGRTSVTELEILHGVLNNPVMAGHAFFYFRDPAYIEGLSEEARGEMVERPLPEEVVQLGEVEAGRRAGVRRAKLAALKERIRRSGMPVLESYASPEALADAVRHHFTALIDQLFPRGEVPDPLDQEATEHEAYAEGKLHGCVERPAHLDALSAFVASESAGRGLVVTGESGGGKTALLASWVVQWRGSHPGDFVFPHYFGATPDSAAVTGFLRRFLAEIKRRYAIEDAIPTESEQLRDALPFWLTQVSARLSAPASSVGERGQLVLILDGLDQAEGDEPDRRLAFLPHFLPPHVRILASALPGSALDSFRARGWVEHPLPAPNVAERNLMITTFLGHYRKTLRVDLRRKLAESPGAANPLYLRTVLEELRQFGSFEALPDRVAHYLEARTPEELFRRVIRRWQEDFDGGQHLVARTLRPLYAARKGLAEAEWLELLAADGAPVSRPTWRPLFLALLPHLSQRSGLYAFGHDFLRRAVKAALLPSVDHVRSAHLALADYYKAQPGMGPRKVEEWPWQLRAAEAWERLDRALLEYGLFAALCNDRTQWELTGYWHPLRALGGDLGYRYAHAFERWLQADPILLTTPSPALKLGTFLMLNGCYRQAELLIRRGLETSEQALGPDHPETLVSMNNLANVMDRMGDYARAEPLYRRTLERQERVLGPDHPHTLTTVNNLGALLSSTGDYVRAESLYRRALESFERVLGPDHRSTLYAVNNLANLLRLKGDYAGAEALYRRALVSRQRVLGLEDPSTLSSLNNLAALLRLKGDTAGAEPLYQYAMEGRERVLGPDHPDTLETANNLAELSLHKGDVARAEALYREILECSERALGPEHPSTLHTVASLAVVLDTRGILAEAERLYRRALEGYERVLGVDHPATLRNASSLADLLRTMGDYVQAEPLARRALEGRERVLGPDHPDTLHSVNNLAVLLFSMGDNARAEPLFRRAAESFQRVLGPDHPTTLTSVENLAAFLRVKGD